MRSLKFFFLSLLIILLFAVAGVILGRELLLYFAVNDLRLAVAELQKGDYQNRCREIYQTQQEYYLQLRFTSAKEYNLELVCVDFEQQPLVIDRRELPLFVRKASPTSGFILAVGAADTYVELVALGRQAFSYLDGQKYHYTLGALPEARFVSGPPSSCAAFNSVCCDLEAQVGQGEKTELATDCPRSCYGSCAVRPILLSFNSRPVANENRILLRSGEMVTFAYVFSDGAIQLSGELAASESTLLQRLQRVLNQEKEASTGASLPISVRLDFGDGNSVSSENLQDSFDHVYTCSTGLCYYQTQLRATDAKGVEASLTELAKLVIEVRN